MKKNVLDLMQVLSVSRQLVEASLGEECTSVNVPVVLLDEIGQLQECMSHSICKKSEVFEAKDIIRNLNGLTKEEFIEKNPYCHISTYPMEAAGYYLASFDPNDDIPCKIEISDGYNYLDYFFCKFNNMRNNLIENHEVVKDDDIYQYLDIVLRANNRAKEPESRFQKIKKRFINK